MNRRNFLKLGLATAIVPIIKFAPAPAPAFAEGSRLPRPLPAMVPLSDDRIVHIGYANAVKGYEHVYPTLARAVKNMRPATSTKIEWLRVKRGKLSTEHNYTQILRTPFGATGTELSVGNRDFENVMRSLRKDALHSHLADVEHTLTKGKRNRKEWVSTCGGEGCFGAGELALRPLRDLVLLKSRQAPDEDRYVEEYLGEFSLQVG